MKKIFVFVSFLIVILFSCHDPHVFSTVKAVKSPNNYQKILVLGISQDNRTFLQEKMETAIADHLRSLGYIAVTSINTYGRGAFHGLSEEAFHAALKAQSIDAVFLVVLLNSGSKTIGEHYSRYKLLEYYKETASEVQNPLYFIHSRDYFWESSLYNAADGSLLGAARTNRFDPVRTVRLIPGFSQKLVVHFTKRKVLIQHPSVAAKGF